MYGRILRQLREAKGRGQAEVARSVGISPAQMARLEANQRGLYVEDFVNIAQALGEKPGNLLANDLGEIGHLKPIIDRLASLSPELLPRVSAIIEKIVLLTETIQHGDNQTSVTAGSQAKRPPVTRHSDRRD
jgi:transcriptional regulator with XRE-family HTH domain